MSINFTKKIIKERCTTFFKSFFVYAKKNKYYESDKETYSSLWLNCSKINKK